MVNSKGQRSPLVTILAYLCGGFLSGLIVLAVGSSRVGWRFPIELASHFQVQYFMVALVVGAIALLTRRKLPILVSLFCVALLASGTLPWYLPQLTLAPEGTPLRILSFNINVRNENYHAILSLIRREQPDIVLLMEVNSTWNEPLNTLNDILPHQFPPSEPGRSGTILLSNLPLNSPEQLLFQSRTPALVADLTIGQQSISLLGMHPFPPIRPDIFHARNEELAEVTDYIQANPQSRILVGDLNITMWSPYYRRLAIRTGLHNTRKGFGVLPSWPITQSDSPFARLISALMGIPIDHCLTTPDIRATAIRTGPALGSDHLPIIVDLQIPTTS